MNTLQDYPIKFILNKEKKSEEFVRFLDKVEQQNLIMYVMNREIVDSPLFGEGVVSEITDTKVIFDKIYFYEQEDNNNDLILPYDDENIEYNICIDKDEFSKIGLPAKGDCIKFIGNLAYGAINEKNYYLTFTQLSNIEKTDKNKLPIDLYDIMENDFDMTGEKILSILSKLDEKIKVTLLFISDKNCLQTDAILGKRSGLILDADDSIINQVNDSEECFVPYIEYKGNSYTAYDSIYGLIQTKIKFR